MVDPFPPSDAGSRADGTGHGKHRLRVLCALSRTGTNTIRPESRIRDDLIKLSAVTDCVRTYSSQRGLQAVPRIAHELGMKVLLGIWIGRNDVDNRLEIEEGIRQAQAWPASIRGVIVGNEVLLRREQTAQGMANYLDTVRAAVTIPVTYADVWEFWVKNESLASHVDYMTVHILPYWEDHPVGIDAAVTHVADIFEQVQARFAGKPMMIGETGWPSAGRQRGPARPGNLAQAEFIRAWTATAKQKNIDYNLIEGFDQPWKRLLEGAMAATGGCSIRPENVNFRGAEPWQKIRPRCAMP